MAGGGRKPITAISMDLPSQGVSFDPDAFNEFLNLQGVRLCHHKALRCPVGMTDVDDNRRPHDDHIGCSNGFIYYKAGIVTAAMQGNSNSQRQTDFGLMENSHITVTYPQFYDETDTSINLAPFDRFYLDEEEPDNKILVPTWHLQTVHASGSDRLYYPAVSVEYLVDSTGKKYLEGQDFCIHDGQIKWTSNNRPGFQVDTGRGAVYSVRYNYRPYWYCTQLLHEIRVAQIQNQDGRALQRLPQQALLAREFVFTNEQKDELAKDSNSLRQTQSPDDGSWGAPR